MGDSGPVPIPTFCHRGCSRRSCLHNGIFLTQNRSRRSREERKEQEGMSTARQPPLRFLNALNRCLRRRRFSVSSPACNDTSKPLSPVLSSPMPRGQQEMADLFSVMLSRDPKPARPDAQSALTSFRPVNTANMPRQGSSASSSKAPLPLPVNEMPKQQPGYFHVHAVSITSNIHVTITDHNHNPVVSMSAGQLGYKHARRRSPEAAYDTTVAAFEKFKETDREVENVEIILKGFGAGRRGFLSALSGQHGEFLMTRAIRVTDATPLVIGTVPRANKRRR